MIERYTRPQMGALWTDLARYRLWFDVELAVCRAMEAEHGVPEGTADRLRERVSLDPGRILDIERETKHDVIAFLCHLEEQAGPLARWLHLGMTSSDVLDTAFALQLRRAGDLLLGALDQLLQALKRRAFEFKDLPMVGRTHGMYAEPITMGLVFAGFFAEFRRDRERLCRAISGISVGKVSGAVGVYGNVTPAIEKEALRILGLVPETCATQVVDRDRHAEFFNTLALIGCGVERVALQVRHWQRSEVGEASEHFAQGQKGSSAMPHKRNPILSENLTGLARLLRSYAQAALEDVPLWHERDISHSSVERVIGPDATVLCDFMLHRLSGLVSGLAVCPERIRAHLDEADGLVFSEAVLLALVRHGLARQQAYALVQRNALAALAGEGGGGFAGLLEKDPEIGAALPMEELRACFDHRRHLRHVDLVFERVFKE